MNSIDYISIALKIIVSLSILNVWLIQPKKPTKWRGGKERVREDDEEEEDHDC